MSHTFLLDMILEEHSKPQTNKIIEWVGSSQQRFDELVKLFMGDEYRVTQRASWPLAEIAIAQPFIIKKHLPAIVKGINRTVAHVAVKRNSLRILQHIEDIPEELQGELMDCCFQLIEGVKETVAVKAFALTVLHNLSKQYPEILPEIKAIVAEQIDRQTAAFKSRAKLFL